MRQPQLPLETFRLAGTPYETDGLGREVMPPETENFMKWCRQKLEEGIKMRVEKPPCTNVFTMCTPPMAGQTCDERTLLGSQIAAVRGSISKKIWLGHVVTTTPGDE